MEVKGLLLLYLKALFGFQLLSPSQEIVYLSTRNDYTSLNISSEAPKENEKPFSLTIHPNLTTSSCPRIVFFLIFKFK